MYTVIVNMKLDPARLSEVRRHFEEDVVPWAKSRPGFVGGQWLITPEGYQGLGMVEFDSLEAATTAADGPRRSSYHEGRAWQIERVTVFEQF